MIKNHRIIFMGSPKISSEYLEVLVNNNFNVVAVYTNPPRPSGRGMNIKNSAVHDKAENLNIPVYHPNNFKDPETLSTFMKLKCDLIIIMAYGKILPKDVLNFPIFGSINIHVSLLPRWRGAAPVEHTLLNGDKKTGVTIFKLVDKLDKGPILAQDSFLIENNCYKDELFNKLNDLGKKLMLKTLPNYFENKIKLIKQNESQATYAPKITSSMTKINFNESISKVFNQIRAFSPKPGSWFEFQNERIKIISCNKKENISLASTIVNEYFHIGCKDGIIEPIIIQREGKNPMEIKDFLKGFNFSVGQKVND